MKGDEDRLFCGWREAKAEGGDKHFEACIMETKNNVKSYALQNPNEEGKHGMTASKLFCTVFCLLLNSSCISFI